MELEFIAKAVRRYWPVVLVCTLISLAVGMLITPAAVAKYQSTALVLMTSGETGSAGDRFVSSELVILQSPPVAQRAAELANVPLSPSALSQSVSFVQIPGTDVVRIIASSSSPETAQAIANGYLDAYLERSGGGPAGTQADREGLDRRVADIEQQLTDVEERVEQVLAPYVEAADSSQPDDEPGSIPAVEDIAPALAVERDVLIEQYRTALQQVAALEFGSDQGPNAGQPIQRAELPSQSLATSSRTLRLAVGFGGFLLGVALATVLARTSRFVLDGAEVEEVLGAPLAAVVPRSRALHTGALDRLEQLPVDVRAPLHHLCVQVEAESAAATGWSIVVTGMRRNVGTTTLAAGIALRFSELGSQVLLIDLDTENPALSEHFDTDGRALAVLLEPGAAEVPTFTPTGFPNLAMAGRPKDAGRWRPSRLELQTVLASASVHADLVVVDAGPMLASSSASVLAQSAEAVVLAVPVRRQPRSPLDLVARQLVAGGHHLFPVAVPVLKTARRRNAVDTANSEAPDRGADGDSDEADEAEERAVESTAESLF